MVRVEARFLRRLPQAKPQAHPQEEPGLPRLRRRGRGGSVQCALRVPEPAPPDQLLEARDGALHGLRQAGAEVVGAVAAHEGEGGPLRRHVGGPQALERDGVRPEDHAHNVCKGHLRRMGLPRGPAVLRPELHGQVVLAQPDVLPAAAGPGIVVAVLVDLEAVVEEEEHLAMATLRHLRPVLAYAGEESCVDGSPPPAIAHLARPGRRHQSLRLPRHLNAGVQPERGAAPG
mmetsp:Transcript_109796/g.310649  ORF Transcript_109796/g.310649 Transcript_109796/m.310649 type:complete len:231 (-) Transcript_109796:111-803(-)